MKESGCRQLFYCPNHCIQTGKQEKLAERVVLRRLRNMDYAHSVRRRRVMILLHVFNLLYKSDLASGRTCHLAQPSLQASASFLLPCWARPEVAPALTDISPRVGPAKAGRRQFGCCITHGMERN